MCEKLRHVYASFATTTGISIYPLVFALLLGGAVVASLFFNGSVIEFFALSMGLLCLLALVLLWRAYGDAVEVPRTSLALFLTLFWAWLAVGVFWSRVPYVSAVNFWWVGSFAFVFWLAMLTPQREQCWRASGLVVLIVGTILASMALYQLLALNSDPRSTFLSRNSHAAMLILIATAASGYFLVTAAGVRRTLLGAVLFLLFLAVAVTGSRGVMLSLLLATVTVAVVSYRHVSRGRFFGWLAIIAAAYVLANLLLEGWLAERLSSVFDPTHSGHDRFLIWRQSWKMLQDAPWFGIGLGTYWLFWPPYRDPLDSSAGFYAHNDYLQIWIETGLPGLLLLLAAEVAVLMVFIRLLRDTRVPVAVRVESAGMLGGLLAIGFHAFFDFDLYVLPILLVIGLMLARMQQLGGAAASFTLRPAARFGRPAWRTITLLLVLFPLLYFTALGFSSHLTTKARELTGQARWVEANEALIRAWQLMPTSDLTLVAHADLLRQAIATLPLTAQTQREEIYREVLALLAKAEKVNPVRAQTPYLRGLLYQDYPELTGPQWSAYAAESYRQALRIDPRAFWARVAYGRMLLKFGEPAEARKVLEGGVNYMYVAEPNVRAYFHFTADLRSQTGDRAGAIALRRQVEWRFRNPPTRDDPFGPKVRDELPSAPEHPTTRP